MATTKKYRAGITRPEHALLPGRDQDRSYPGCCKPFPDVRFSNGDISEVHLRHIGPGCYGYWQPVSIREWRISVPKSLLTEAQRAELRSKLEEEFGEREPYRGRR